MKSIFLSLFASALCGSCPDLNGVVGMGSVSLPNILFPGTHNSFSYGLKKCGSGDLKLDAICTAYSISQTSPLSEMLNNGIRALDLDVCNNGNTVSPCHAIFVRDIGVTQLFNELNTWLNTHPCQIVMLRFSNAENEEAAQKTLQILSSSPLMDHITPLKTLAQYQSLSSSDLLDILNQSSEQPTTSRLITVFSNDDYFHKVSTRDYPLFREYNVPEFYPWTEAPRTPVDRLNDVEEQYARADLNSLFLSNGADSGVDSDFNFLVENYPFFLSLKIDRSVASGANAMNTADNLISALARREETSQSKSFPGQISSFFMDRYEANNYVLVSLLQALNMHYSKGHKCMYAFNKEGYGSGGRILCTVEFIADPNTLYIETMGNSDELHQDMSDENVVNDLNLLPIGESDLLFAQVDDISYMAEENLSAVSPQDSQLRANRRLAKVDDRLAEMVILDPVTGKYVYDILGARLFNTFGISLREFPSAKAAVDWGSNYLSMASKTVIRSVIEENSMRKNSKRPINPAIFGTLSSSNGEFTETNGNHFIDAKSATIPAGLSAIVMDVSSGEVSVINGPTYWRNENRILVKK